MQTKTLRSGLVVPAQPEKPQPPRGPLEVHDEDRRAAVRNALLDIWHAAELGRSGAIIFPGDAPMKASHQRELWYLFGKMLLGNDAPSVEVKT